MNVCVSVLKSDKQCILNCLFMASLASSGCIDISKRKRQT